MIKSIIIDDERKSRDFLEKLILKYLSDKLEVICKLSCIEDSIDAINNHCPDLIFLDIRLNNNSGLELLYHYKDTKPFDVIFVTGYKDYGIDAVKYNAVDYILKPVNINDLVSAIDRYEKKLFESRNLFEGRRHAVDADKISNSIAFPSKNGYVLEKISSIIYCEAKGNKTDIYLKGKDKIKVSKTLKDVEKMINHFDFFRIHKSFYLNMNFINSYNKSDHLVELNTGIHLPVSVRKNDGFKKKLISRN
tara:strand:+ start:243 stop:989 length:747 start_codon:yes stop_codon:yes gene_type:complete